MARKHEEWKSGRPSVIRHQSADDDMMIDSLLVRLSTLHTTLSATTDYQSACLRPACIDCKLQVASCKPIYCCLYPINDQPPHEHLHTYPPPPTPTRTHAHQQIWPISLPSPLYISYVPTAYPSSIIRATCLPSCCCHEQLPAQRAYRQIISEVTPCTRPEKGQVLLHMGQ